ncbi:hypothetical protein FWF89_01055 [Candidatus Saccharibacteria bacterium]|nr:hypothetical protein [Candidatus Saccharibacteria bacterium]
MKKIKKDRKSAGRKIATGIILICVLVVAVGFGCSVQKQLDSLQDRTWLTSWETGLFQNSRELQASDDGKWFLIPEVRIRMPFFAQWKADGEMWLDAPRYSQYIWVSPEIAVAFNNWFDGTYRMDEEFLGQGCMDPFIMRIDSDGSVPNDIVEAAKYETFYETRLADDREVKLQMRTAGPGECMRYMEGTWGEKMKEALSKIESY